MKSKMRISIFKKLLGVLVFVLFKNFCSAQSFSTIHDFVKTKADSFFIKEKLPGIMVIVNDGTTTELYTNGFANVEAKTLFDINTIFEAGSITKTFTAFMVESVLRDNNINESASIAAYLPDSVKANTVLSKITFLSLLNHTSGLPRLPENFEIKEGDMQPYKNYGEKKLYAYLKNADVGIDQKYEYSNLGTALAGVIASRIAKKPYKKLLEQYILLPFKMKDEEKNIATNKNKSQGYFENIKVDYWDMNILSPAGGIKCSGKEMFSYLQNISNPTNELNKKIVDSLLSPTVVMNPRIRIGRAWHTFEQKDKPLVYWHNGGTYGFSTFVGFIKGTNKKVLVVINKFNANNAADFIGISVMKKLTQ
jgi:CubicO group peptidase (beta-lactamase class C family)